MSTYFELLELPTTFDIDVKVLDERYRARSQQWHPDRFAQAPAKERIHALEQTTQLNAAYKALRDPSARGAYLLSLLGLDLDREDAHAHQMEPAFLMEILELREQLEAAREARDLDRALALGKQIEARKQESLSKLGPLFDAQLKAADPARLKQIADQVAALRYYRRFLDEVSQVEEEVLG